MQALTRRQLAAALAGASTALQAQTPPAAAEDLTAAARDQIRRNAEALAKVEVPMSTEPAVHFKA